MSPDELAFIAAILVAPDDDAPRLIYADWLQENAGTVPCGECKDGKGEYVRDGSGVRVMKYPRAGCCKCSGTGYVSDGNAERAEFIRAQCRLARLPLCDRGMYGAHCSVCDDCKERRPLVRRVEGLWYLPGKGFTPPLPESVWCFSIGEPYTPERGQKPLAFVRRGFIEVVACTAEAWLAKDAAGRCNADAITAQHPVREVRLTTIPMLEHEGYARRIAGRKALVPVRYTTRSHVELCLEAEWPGITFHLPPAGRLPSAVRDAHAFLRGAIEG